MQDVHWSCGLLGYFPTYTLGNLRAAQLFASAREALPGLSSSIGQGEFGGLKEWLVENVHRHGRRFPGDELMERATGSKTGTAPFLAYLEEKYAGLYGI
jgi:carboxypeptidase Taq